MPAEPVERGTRPPVTERRSPRARALARRRPVAGRTATRGPTTRAWTPSCSPRGDTRNVVDEYRYWRMDAIVADLDERRHPFHVAIENWQHDMNIGSIVRSANAFLAAEVHIVGRRRWNRRGAMVTDRYQHVRHHEDVAAFAAWADAASLPIIAVDNLPGAVPVDRADLPGAVRAAVRSGGTGAVGGGAGRGIREHRDHPVRLDPLDQRLAPPPPS